MGNKQKQDTPQHIPPELIQHEGWWWSPPFPPFWDDWIGPYEFELDAQLDREGVTRTINTPEHQSMMIDMEEEFEEEWQARLLPKFKNTTD